MGGTGVAVRAAMAASPVRVDAGVEPDVGAVVAGDDGARSISQVYGLGRCFLRVVLCRVGLYLDPLEAVLRVAGGSAATMLLRFPSLSLTG